MLDLSKPYDAHIDRRLRTEPVIWLCTSGRSGQPHMAPMWFLWDGSTITLFSLPSTRKLRDLAANSRVALALEAADCGYDIVMLEGVAALIGDPRVTAMMPSFVAKYATVPRRWPPEEWAAKFTQAIRVTPARFIGWMTRPGDTPQHKSLKLGSPEGL